MAEQHFISGPARGEPMPDGEVGARVRIPLSGTPTARWSRVVEGRLTKALIGHPHVGHLHIRHLVRGADLVLEGVEEREAEALGPALREAVAAANRKTAGDPPPPPENMSQELADRIAEALGLDDERPAVLDGTAHGLDRELVASLH